MAGIIVIFTITIRGAPGCSSESVMGRVSLCACMETCACSVCVCVCACACVCVCVSVCVRVRTYCRSVRFCVSMWFKREYILMSFVFQLTLFATPDCVAMSCCCVRVHWKHLICKLRKAT